ncbi:hypothetical protein L0Y59_02770, partial [Candidatus Uhrbacteria bacterium]|nr:hypothetical protein [Candidatus Uhrbacteria bacterium]
MAAPSWAAKASPASYSVSRHQVSQAADHEVRFKTPTGVDAPTDTVILTYYSGFNLSAVGVGDVDLFHGPSTGVETPESLASAPAA